MTSPRSLTYPATSLQNVTEWSRSGIGFCPCADVVPGADQCNSRMGYRPLAAARWAKSAMAAWYVAPA